MSKKPAAKKPAKSPSVDIPASQRSTTPAVETPIADTAPVVETPTEATYSVPDLGPSEIVNIPMSKIDLSPKSEQVRSFDPEDREYLRKVEFAATNRKWISNVVVTRIEGGRYKLIAGRNRFEASKVNDWKEIEARVYEKEMDVATALSVGLMENIHSKTMTKAEIAATMAAIMRRDPKATIGGFAAAMNVTKNTVRNILALNDLAPEATRRTGKGEIPLANAYQLATLPLDVQEADDGAWIKSAAETKTLKFVKAVQEFLKDLKGDKTGTTRAASKERAKAAPKAIKPLNQTALEELLGEIMAADPEVVGAINESFQDGMIFALRSALGQSPSLPASSQAGFQAKPASSRTA